MNTDWKKIRNQEIEKHNKRVKSIREVRLSKADREAIDAAMQSMDSLHESLCESVISGYFGTNIEEITEFARARNKMLNQFAYKEKIQ